ncbi:MAG: hypothetical protein C7B45_10540 [Sulfobacillus acidophilus]|uniref:DUF2357 domain-containing protein n=1 Tax=Sulfobacillus acidophilus TaxID=53633 RepID=A0A2T2WH23_9FIRM|nr:MAG: hypothetical protein C7B45_10540 [Sulfobacillus acidophilus]
MRRSGDLLLRVTMQDAVIALIGPSTVPLYGDEVPGINHVEAFPIGRAVLEIPREHMGFFDDVQYTIQVSALVPLEVTQNHRPVNLTWVQHGMVYMATMTMQFRQVGWTELRVGDAGIRIKIDSRKMDYDTDYRAMIWDLENQVRGLTAKLVSAVLQGMEESPDGSMDLWSYWLSVLEVIWEQLMRDVTHAWTTLPMQLSAEERRIYLDRRKKVGRRDIWAYARSNDPRIVTQVRIWESLTAERVYLLQLLQWIRRRLERVRNQVSELEQHRRLNIILHDVGVLVARLSATVGVERVAGEPRIPSSPLAQSHPALRRVVRWHRLLQNGLFPDGDRYFVGIKDINLLYEYWCYLMIVRLVVEESGGTLMVHPRISRDPMDILLSSGAAQAAQVELPTGECVSILYERRFSGLPTVAQQPDHVVELKGLGPLLIFDAKYRFEMDDDYIKHYGKGAPIPPIDTINGMHQYHDAIVGIKVPYERLVDRAIVLFPLPRRFFPNWHQHRFYQSIESVGVGALPLLPGGDDTYVRNQIHRYLNLK